MQLPDKVLPTTIKQIVLSLDQNPGLLGILIATPASRVSLM